ncbi:MAG: hypothetical protein WCG08_03870 [Paludibacter sp.]
MSNIPHTFKFITALILVEILSSFNFAYSRTIEVPQKTYFKDVIGKIYVQLNYSKQPSPDYLYKNFRIDTVKHVLYGVEYGMKKEGKKYLETSRRYSVDLSDIRFIYMQREDADSCIYIAIENKSRKIEKDHKLLFQLSKSTTNTLKNSLLNDLKQLCQLCGSRPTVFQTDALKRNLKGEVAMIIETETDFNHSESKTNEITKATSKISFNRVGNVVEVSTLDSTKHISGKTTFKQNFRGQLIEESSFYDDGKPYSKHRYEYDLQGNLLSETDSSKRENPAEKRKRRTKYTYQEKTDTLITNQFDFDGFRILKSVSITTDSLTETNEFKYNRDDSLFMKYSFKYDKSGNLIESCFYSADGKLDIKNSYLYKNAQLIEKDAYYNPRMRLELATKYLYAYNDDGNLCDVLECDINGVYLGIYPHSYELDKKGNWIKQTINQNDRIISIKRRKISYY